MKVNGFVISLFRVLPSPRLAEGKSETLVGKAEVSPIGGFLGKLLDQCFQQLKRLLVSRLDLRIAGDREIHVALPKIDGRELVAVFGVFGKTIHQRPQQSKRIEVRLLRLRMAAQVAQFPPQALIALR